MSGYGSSQLRYSGTGRGLQQPGGFTGQYFSGQLCPYGKRKVLPGRGGVREIRSVNRRYFPEGRFRLRTVIHRILCYADGRKTAYVRHKVPPPWGGGDISLGDQLLIGGLHRNGTDPEIAGQTSLGWQLFTGIQDTG